MTKVGIMDEKNIPAKEEKSQRDLWEIPEILEEGRIEAKLFSDEPDPWGGP